MDKAETIKEVLERIVRESPEIVSKVYRREEDRKRLEADPSYIKKSDTVTLEGFVELVCRLIEREKDRPDERPVAYLTQYIATHSDEPEVHLRLWSEVPFIANASWDLDHIDWMDDIGILRVYVQKDEENRGDLFKKLHDTIKSISERGAPCMRVELKQLKRSDYHKCNNAYIYPL